MKRNSSSGSHSPSTVVLIVAASVLLCFGIMVVALLRVAGGSSETTWSRLVFIYSGVEAIVFAAAGAIFGTQIQRSQTVAAEQRTAVAESEAQDALRKAEDKAKDANAGVALRHAIEAEYSVKRQSTHAMGRPEQGLGGSKVGSRPPTISPEPVVASDGDRDSMTYLVELARRLFED